MISTPMQHGRIPKPYIHTNTQRRCCVGGLGSWMDPSSWRYSGSKSYRSYACCYLAWLSSWWQLKYFSCSSRTLGKWSNLTTIFQIGWNHHQLWLVSLPCKELTTKTRFQHYPLKASLLTRDLRAGYGCCNNVGMSKNLVKSVFAP